MILFGIKRKRSYGEGYRGRRMNVTDFGVMNMVIKSNVCQR